MTFEKLSSLIEQNNFKNKTDFIIAIKLYDAINDWPKSVFTVEEFIHQLEHELGDKAFLQNIVHKLDFYTIENDAWKIESLSSIKEILELDIHQDLKTIVKEFEERYIA